MVGGNNQANGEPQSTRDIMAVNEKAAKLTDKK
jgi:hypothetical protein